MRFNGSHLYNLARASAVAELGAEEQVLVVPPVLSPIITIPLEVSEVGGFVVTDNQRQSFIAAGQQLTRAASQATTTQTLCTFGRGLWLIRLHYLLAGDFTQAFTDTVTDDGVFIGISGGSTTHLLIGLQVANVPHLQFWEGRMLFPRDDWRLTLSIGATGAGQTKKALATVSAQKLL